ncbi:MAG: pyridoxal-phosphate dependent enzyme, partial [Candidatus Hydrogenedentales bacterium]
MRRSGSATRIRRPAARAVRDAAQEWHYRALLPIAAEVAPVTLHEGATPLVPATRLQDELGLRELTFKYEGANPTGAFKDRQISVGITHAKSLRVDTVVVRSSGNVACSAAAYAARAGMRAVIFLHALAAPAKRRMAAAYGARVLAFDTASSREVFDLCREACAKFGWYNLTTAGMYAPYNVEVAKTIAYELYQQTNGKLFDWLIVPVDGGGMLGA